ncbi:MAG: DNA cytosine methyltransferase [Actinobacteria bacterium]|nr:DNA cytosine methyltransferase [Actinomycetota bacterium]
MPRPLRRGSSTARGSLVARTPRTGPAAPPTAGPPASSPPTAASSTSPGGATASRSRSSALVAGRRSWRSGDPTPPPITAPGGLSSIASATTAAPTFPAFGSREAGVSGRRIVDLFAGAGGWEEGLRTLGHRALGIECDPLACATARAAGHERLEADIAALDPEGFGPLWGLIASPPCQAYSIAGKKLGRADKAAVIACAHELAAGLDSRSRHLEGCADGRSLLTVEPLRWALALRPRWIALEQVPAVLELWELFADLLGSHGYQCAAGLLSAERYGVPQVRKRAFLIASLDGAVALPAPTHRSFHPRRHSVPPEEADLPSWVSMAEALGWGTEPATLRSNHTSSGRIPGGAPRSLDRPSFTLIGSSYTWRIEKGVRQEDVAPRPGWARRRPATTVLGEPRVFGPGSWPRNGHPAHKVRRETVRVTVEQASILQGFRHDYPWQGPRTARFRQIGNAVCPPVGRAVLAEAMRPSLASGRRISDASDDASRVASRDASDDGPDSPRRPPIRPRKRPRGVRRTPKSSPPKEVR